jgi:hypothetical protein
MLSLIKAAEPKRAAPSEYICILGRGGFFFGLSWISLQSKRVRCAKYKSGHGDHDEIRAGAVSDFMERVKRGPEGQHHTHGEIT